MLDVRGYVAYHGAELGINPTHILQKSLTVLNPLSRVDGRIMDDADLAGPFVFCFAFAFVLLLVSRTSGTFYPDSSSRLSH